MEKEEAAFIDTNGKGKNDLVTSAPVSILLLYRRDDLQIARRAVELRNRLQSECGTKVKVNLIVILCRNLNFWHNEWHIAPQFSGLRLRRRKPVGRYRPRRFGLATEKDPLNINDSIRRFIVIHRTR